MYENDTIGPMDNKKLRAVRKRLGLTQEELAKRLGKKRLSIIRYEKDGTAIPKAIELAMKAIEAEERK
jgi:DNA-binding XRE family transcriptional regulator